MLFHPQEKGQGLVEYSIILVFVAIVVIAILRWLGPKVGNIFSTINSSPWKLCRQQAPIAYRLSSMR